MLDPRSLGPEEAARAALHAIWTFPTVLLSAFVMAWAAEGAQFYMSQGLALALLAWLQTLPEFAVEAVIAWRGDVPLMTANFTGALRLLTGLGWPMIWVVYMFSERARGRHEWLPAIELDREHAATVVGLAPPLAVVRVDRLEGHARPDRRGRAAGDVRGLPGAAPAHPALGGRRTAEESPRVVRALLALPEPWRRLGVIALFLAGRRGALLHRLAVPRQHEGARDDDGRLDVRVRAVGRAVPLRDAREDQRLLLGPQPQQGGHGAHEHGVART